MKFEPNPELDETRKSYKDQYDAAFIKRRFTKKDSSEYAVLTKRLRFMENRTAMFINKNHTYFSRKRYFLFDRLEKRGVFGDKPSTDFHEEVIDRTRVNGIPKTVKKLMVCEECKQSFWWYENRPERTCRLCRRER